MANRHIICSDVAHFLGMLYPMMVANEITQNQYLLIQTAHLLIVPTVGFCQALSSHPSSTPHIITQRDRGCFQLNPLTNTKESVMKTLFTLLVTAVIICTAAISSSFAADDVWIEIKDNKGGVIFSGKIQSSGTVPIKQGACVGSVTVSNRTANVEVLSFSWGASNPSSFCSSSSQSDPVSFGGVKTAREAGSGMATGRRQYEPVVITKRIDKSTPLIAKSTVGSSSDMQSSTSPAMTLSFDGSSLSYTCNTACVNGQHIKSATISR